MTAADALGELPELVSPEVSRTYGRFLAEQASDDAYLFTDARVRFEARDDDILVAAPGLVAEKTERGTLLRASSLPRTVEVLAAEKDIARFLSALDGERTLAEARSHSALEPNAVEELLRATFGLCLFAPVAVAELEHRVPAAEIVRFPGSPYEIPRSYWTNMASVRRGIPKLFEELASFEEHSGPRAALDELRKLHVVSLVGDDGRSFYRPASPIAKKGIVPGKLFLAASRTLETPEGTRFVEGPRVNASFVGGERYGALVAELSGDARAVGHELEQVDSFGLSWGRVVVARAEDEQRDAPWFCPPRPLSLAHLSSAFVSLARALSAIQTSDQGSVSRELADFHWKLVRLHPFRAANQSLVMSIVNAVLGKRSEGTGIPHLVLDQFALRLAPDAYRRLFALAVSEWTTSGLPAERWRKLATKKRRAYAFIERVQASINERTARAVAEESADDARLSLVCVRREE